LPSLTEDGGAARAALGRLIALQNLLDLSVEHWTLRDAHFHVRP